MWYDMDDPYMMPAKAVSSPQKVRGHANNGLVCGGDPRYNNRREVTKQDEEYFEKLEEDFSYLEETDVN
jgi:hypothetical protein